MPQRATDERSRWPESVFTFPESVFNLPGMRVHLRPESVFKIVRNTPATAVLPHVIVPPVDPVSGNHRYLNMQFLQGDCDDPARQIPEALEELCSTYESWIVERVAEARRWCADSARWASSGRHVDHRDRRRVMISM